MIELLQKALDFGLSWVATIGLAWYVYHQNKEHKQEMKTITKEHKEEIKEITKEYTDKVESISENYTNEVTKLRESVDNNTIAFKALYDVLVKRSR